MEERIVTAVSTHRVLYDASDYLYRDRKEKELAWRAVSEEVGAPEDFCRKRWKSLRDTYMKEVKKEKEAKRSGAATGQKWRYLAVLSFLEPHVTPRQSSNSQIDEDEAAAAAITANTSSPGDDFPSEIPSPEEPEEGPVSPSEAPAAAAAAADLPPPSHPTAPRRQWRRRARPYDRGELSVGEEKILKALQAQAAALPPPPPPPPPRTTTTTPTPPPPPSPAAVSSVQHFFNSIIPLVENMPPEKQEYIKFTIHKFIYDNRHNTPNEVPLNPQ